jgi:hypothetical protein
LVWSFGADGLATRVEVFESREAALNATGPPDSLCSAAVA